MYQHAGGNYANNYDKSVQNCFSGAADTGRGESETGGGFRIVGAIIGGVTNCGIIAMVIIIAIIKYSSSLILKGEERNSL